MKKKIIAISLITSMVICNSMTVWAADTWDDSGYHKDTDGNNATGIVEDNNNAAYKDVTASFDLTGVADSISVTITWGPMSYKPNTTLTGEWKIAGYFQVNGFNKWVPSVVDSVEVENKIKVENNSNKTVYAELRGEVLDSYKDNYIIDNDNKDSACMTFTSDSVTNYSSTVMRLGTVFDESYPNEKEIEVGVDAALEKSPLDSISDLTIGTVTIELNTVGFNG